MKKKNRYRIVVDLINSGQDEIKVTSTFKTLNEAKEACKTLRSLYNNYYVQEYKGSKWNYVGPAPKLTFPIKTVEDTLTHEKIVLPFEVVLTRKQAQKQITGALEIIKQLVKHWPKEAK